MEPGKHPADRPDLAFNTAISFMTNTNWQAYGGESTLSYFSQMVGLTVQNFVSAATGMAVAVAVARGLAARSTGNLGNFWVDLTRSVLYVLLPLAIVVALVLAWQGVPHSLSDYTLAQTLEGGEQLIAQGPAASQVAIKQLGTNGGGFFSVNSAHPLENPTILSNMLQSIAILLVPVAFPFLYGRLVGDMRQGVAIFATMAVLFVASLAVVYTFEQAGNPLFGPGVDQAAGNMEGKEQRFGVALSALWAAATTAASNGSVNAMHDSFMPLSGLALLLNMQSGEVVFGGVGAGLYGMLVYVVLAVFLAGLMVGRTPEYLGKKVEAREVKLAVIAFLIMPIGILVFGALAATVPAALEAVSNPGPHGLSQILYAYSSATGNTARPSPATGRRFPSTRRCRASRCCSDGSCSPAGARHCREHGGEDARPRLVRDLSDARGDVRRAARADGADPRRAHVLPCAGARADRGAFRDRGRPDLLKRPDMSSKTIVAGVTPAILAEAAHAAFAKLDPRRLARNPVIFVTFIVAALTTLLFLRDLLTGTRGTGVSAGHDGDRRGRLPAAGDREFYRARRHRRRLRARRSGLPGAGLLPPAAVRSRLRCGGSGASNLAPTNAALIEAVRDRAMAWRELSGGQTAPVDAVTTSGSGLDPDISVANAGDQIARVADARGVPVEDVRSLVAAHTEGPWLGFVGAPRLNVLLLNLALDAAAPAAPADAGGVADE